MSVSVIIPTRNQHKILDQALKSIARSNTDGLDQVEIIVIDNQSDEPDSQRYLKELATQSLAWGLNNVQVMSFDEPFNFSKMNNNAVEKATGDILCFLNNDAEVISDDWLHQLTQEVLKSATGCVGTLLFYPNDTVQHAGVIVGMGTIAGHAYVGLPRNAANNHPYFQQKRFCTAVTGACLTIRRDVFETVGGFDSDLAVAFNDVDLCLKVRKAGYNNVFLPSVQLYHHESISRGVGIKSNEEKKRHRQEIRHMRRAWGKDVLTDPYWICCKKARGSDDKAYRYDLKRVWRKDRTLAYSHKDLG